MKEFFVYMMTNKSRVVLYTGMTNNLERRIWEHVNHTIKSFTSRYRVDRLVYYEAYRRAIDAITREKEIKGWRREKKNDLVASINPRWDDLALSLFSASPLQSGDSSLRSE